MAKDTVSIKLIVGLGNPGSQYEHTRHNIGVDFLYLLARKYNIDLRPEGKFQGILGRGNIHGNEVRLLFPTTFMNESGRSVAALCNFYKIQPEEILVCHDDLDLNPGFMKLKFAGGLAGHNGLRSITANLSNSQNYYRLRLGIGKPPSKEVINWVLGRPDTNDQILIDNAYNTALDAIDKLFTDGISKATALVNGYKPN
ncbi:peptidyl-tRNA hydrolase, PTH1 family [Succinivibrio dextrinosolvens]|uniref:aminoacyl-tRNA hydrolase n=1 Tax=Succinivibrio dextrinosolvens TaxID=83771 RepID=UPI0008EC8B11|nr:aminoacyl-tRNA hydrolase [Succinivibrio dextrinosolvens]SFS36417.1 peptidyl-tRNA hydrolase, PTH1 family [Succinivibrio dextrinosolvens]